MSHIVYYDASMPLNGDHAAAQQLAQAVASAGDAAVVTSTQLGSALQAADARVLVTLHGPYFPTEAWPSILAFLRQGGGLIAIGGAPFKRPARLIDGKWVAEHVQTGYHQQLHIHEILPVDASAVTRLASSDEIPLLAGDESLFDCTDTWNLVPHVTKTVELPEQMGSVGPMDTRIYALLKGISEENRELSAPVVLWEQVGGPFVGGRWLFVNQPVQNGLANASGALLKWTAFCAAGVTDLWLKPNYAAYEPGERAVLTLQSQALNTCTAAARSGLKTGWSIKLTVSRDGAQPVWVDERRIMIGEEWEALRIPVPHIIEPGLYHVECRAVSDNGETRLLRQGFWGRDEALLAASKPVTAGRDYFEKDGRPLPVVGMTYMTSDVSRKFIFLPNAAVWDRDMAQMSRAGINWIRTGIWTAYRNVMQTDGHASEEVLRAIDAFVLTAVKNGLHLTFTFFSFTPETWEGVNPYLDPRSVQAQKRFIRAIVTRHRHTAGVDWDLINEPSMFDPVRIFSDGPRTCGDPYEQAAYIKWLRERHLSVEVLRERWNMTPEQLPDFEAAKIPEASEINFDIQDIHQGKKGTRWLDYVLFSMDMHNRWASELTQTIKEICPDRLVTVGQDEALGAQRPSPFFYGEEVDYTTVHSWWLNDHLVWDGVFAKTADKPCLVQETGIMYVETPDGRAKRTEAELRNMLERKYAYAFSTGGAGAVQWIWNTNFYMDNANESHIGALRADGTEKPEADVSYRFGSFMAQCRDLFVDRKLEDIAVVFPYSNDFSNRKLAFDATTRATRVLAYELKVSFRGVSEYHLDDLARDPAKLIIVPSAHNMDSAAIEKLLAIVEETGATLLWTGPFGLDAYWRPVSRGEALLGQRKLANVRREERLSVAGLSYTVSYGARRIAQVCKETGEQAAGLLAEATIGRGRLLWCGLPVELNDRYEPVAALYREAIRIAGCEQELIWEQGGDLAGVYGRKLTFASGALYVFVSEYGEDADVAVRDVATGRRYTFRLESDRSVLFAVDAAGEVAAVYRPDEVNIDIVTK